MFHVEQTELRSNIATTRRSPHGIGTTCTGGGKTDIASAPTSKANFVARVSFRTCSGRTARETIQSELTSLRSAAVATTRIFRSPREASRRNTAFLWSASIKQTDNSGRAIARGRPGNPAPEPTSATLKQPSGNTVPKKRDSQK